jgi:hypothetical protein
VVQLVTFMSTTGEAGFFMQTFGLLSGLVLITHWHRTRTLALDVPAAKTVFRLASKQAVPAETAPASPTAS